MSFQKYFARIRHIDSLIRIKATGTVTQLAKKLNLSERTTMEYVKELKELGCPIKYCRRRKSYYYTEEGKVHISFFDKHFEELKNSGGGGKNSLNFFVKKRNCKNTAVKNYNLVFWFYYYSIINYPSGTKFYYKPKQCCSKLYAVA